MTTIQWSQWVEAFFAGMFLANCVPHFVHGISGDKFPTPFAKPPGKGLSSPLVNVLWGCFNLLIGYLLFQAAAISSDNKPLLIVFFIGIVILSSLMSIRFSTKNKE